MFREAPKTPTKPAPGVDRKRGGFQYRWRATRCAAPSCKSGGDRRRAWPTPGRRSRGGSILDFPEHLNIPAPAALSQMPGDDRRGSVCQYHCPKQAPRLFPTVAGVGPWSFLGDGGRGVSRLPANAGEGPRKILQRRARTSRGALIRDQMSLCPFQRTFCCHARVYSSQDRRLSG
jgi:hypothetical protein